VAVDEPLLDGDYIANQRELMAQQEQDEILERLARRMGEGSSSRQKHLPCGLVAWQAVKTRVRAGCW
jgi:hypothetical protein